MKKYTEYILLQVKLIQANKVLIQNLKIKIVNIFYQHFPNENVSSFILLLNI